MTRRTGWLLAEEDVFADGQFLNERELLKMIADPRVFRITDMPRNCCSLVINEYLALIRARRIDARQHLHQRRFSGTVLADQRMKLALLRA